MSLRTPLGRIRGLGTAGEGSAHWWAQRLTSIALVPLAVWFVASLAAMAGADYFAVRDWIGSPVVAGLLILLIVTTFIHGVQGVQVIIEDYVHNEGMKVAGLLAVKALAVVLGLTGVLSVLVVLFGG
jgi:succinate dehydrogenase / fumarate reductase membrane anchor subunit